MEESLRDAAAGVYPGQKQAAADIQTEAGTMRPDLMLERLFDLPERDYSQYSPLTLAYMGDVVYDLVIRTILVRRGGYTLPRARQSGHGLDSPASGVPADAPTACLRPGSGAGHLAPRWR